MPGNNKLLSQYCEDVLVIQEATSVTRISEHRSARCDNSDAISANEAISKASPSMDKTTLLMIVQDNACTHQCVHPEIKKLHQSLDSAHSSSSADACPFVKASVSRWWNSSALADSLTAISSVKCIEQRRHQKQRRHSEPGGKNLLAHHEEEQEVYNDSSSAESDSLLQRQHRSCSLPNIPNRYQKTLLMEQQASISVDAPFTKKMATTAARKTMRKVVTSAPSFPRRGVSPPWSDKSTIPAVRVSPVRRVKLRPS